MALHRVLGCRLLAIAFAQHLILQAAGQGNHIFFLGILCQIFLAFLAGSLSFLCTLSVHLSLLLGKIVLYDLLGFAVRHLQLVSRNHVLDRLCEVIDVHVGSSTHLHKLLSDAQSEGIA